MKHAKAMGVAAFAAAIIATSCGGSSSSDVSDQPSAEDVQELIESGQVDEIADAAGVSETCVELSMAMAAASGGMVPGSQDSSIDVEAMSRSFDAIRDQAPEELRSDVDVVKEGMVSYLGILAEFGNDFSALMMDPEASERFSAVFDDERFSVAADNFSQWLTEVCAE